MRSQFSVMSNGVMLTASVYRDLTGIVICNRDSDFTWFTLRGACTKLSIAEHTKQEKYDVSSNFEDD